jgi:RNA polymerase sigma factor (sigma-70 family)
VGGGEQNAALVWQASASDELEKDRSKGVEPVEVRVEVDPGRHKGRDMATSPMNEFVQHLRRAVLRRDGADLTDGQLLGEYVSRRDEAALAALVRRHGPMVWGVCRRLLNHEDAEDAFQSVFLVLVRKAASIASRELLANWLYGVAHQTARKARATAARRCARERHVTQMPEPAVAEPDLWRDLQPLLDQELSRLPDKYRAVIVLCDLEGKTRKEAARQLGVPEGTVASRMATARTMLARRLARHGLAVSGGALATVASEQVATASVPSSVVSSTIKAASLFAAGQAATTGMISGQVVALTEGVLKTMLLTKLRVATAGLLLVVLLGMGGGVTALLAGEGSGEVADGVAVAPQKGVAQKEKAEGLDGLRQLPVAGRLFDLKETKEAEDAKFIRRTYVDVLGVLPTPEEVKRFQEDKALDKGKKLVARLHVKLTMRDALKKMEGTLRTLPDDESRRLALEEIEQFVKAMKEKPPEAKDKPPKE